MAKILGSKPDNPDIMVVEFSDGTHMEIDRGSAAFKSLMNGDDKKKGLFKRIKDWWGNRSTGEKIAIVGLGLTGITVGTNLLGAACNLRATHAITDGVSSDPLIDCDGYLESSDAGGVEI